MAMFSSEDLPGQAESLIEECDDVIQQANDLMKQIADEKQPYKHLYEVGLILLVFEYFVLKLRG